MLVHDTSGHHEDVQELEEELLVEEYAGGCREYDAKCYTCQQVKAEHKKPRGTPQPLPILEWN